MLKAFYCYGLPMLRRVTAYSRTLLAVFFVAAGLLHFWKTPHYVAIMPPYLPYPKELVLISGLFEVAGGLGVLHPRSRRLAGWGLILLSVAVLPANVEMLRQQPAGYPFTLATWLLILRLPMQAVIIAWIYRAAVATSANPGRGAA